MPFKNDFILLTLIILLININSKLQIKFSKHKSLLSEFLEQNIAYFVSYFIENIYSTQVYIGEPSQKIIGFLKPDKSGFYLTNDNVACVSKSFYNFKKSNSFKMIDKISQKYHNIHHFLDTFLIENITNSESIQSKIDDFEIMLIGDLKQSLCFIFGTKLISFAKELKNNFLYSLHKKNYIKSYYFSYNINTRNNDELTFIFDIDINKVENDYKFIKTPSKNEQDTKYLVWGLNFDKIYLNNYILVEKQSRAEFNINLGTLIAPSSFRDSFKIFLERNNIMETIIEYNKKYYIYVFEESIFDKLKNFTIDFYHKGFDFFFVLNYKDLFYQKFGKIYFLIIFDYKENNYWKFGLPFFKKYKFIYNYDSKTIGFFNSKNSDINDNNSLSHNNFFKSYGLIIIIIALILLLVIILIFIGILIGKKLYQARKIRTNELPDLYEYNSINK
jgi:hypothetical protein